VALQDLSLKVEAIFSSETIAAYLPASPHGITTQKTSMNIFIVVRTSNFI
jgi:hypothetical protein